MGSLALCAATLPFSVKLCHVFIIVFVLICIFEGKWREKASVIRQSLLLQLLIAFLLLQVAGLLFTNNITTGWFSVEKKIFLVLLPLCLATTSIRLGATEIKTILITFVIACFAGSVYCIFNSWHETNLVLAGDQAVNPYLSGSQYSNLHPAASDKWLLFSYVSLSAGINIHPTYFSLFLAFCIIFLLNEIPSWVSRLQKAAALLLIMYFAVFIVFLSSRIIIFFVAGVLLFVVVRCATRRRTTSALIAMAVAVLFCTLLFLNPVSRYRSLEEIGSSTFQIDHGRTYTTAAQIRLSLWWTALRSLEDWDPVVGFGTGGVERAMSRTSDEVQVTNSINSKDPHNQFLYSLLANGIPAFLLLICCLALPAFLAWRQKDFTLLGLSIMFILLCFTESALELQKGIVFYSLFTGIFCFQVHSFQNFSINLKTLPRVG